MCAPPRRRILHAAKFSPMPYNAQSQFFRILIMKLTRPRKPPRKSPTSVACQHYVFCGGLLRSSFAERVALRWPATAFPCRGSTWTGHREAQPHPPPEAQRVCGWKCLWRQMTPAMTSADLLRCPGFILWAVACGFGRWPAGLSCGATLFDAIHFKTQLKRLYSYLHRRYTHTHTRTHLRNERHWSNRFVSIRM